MDIFLSNKLQGELRLYSQGTTNSRNLLPCDGSIPLAFKPYAKMASILTFFCLHSNEPFLPRSRKNILLIFELKTL